MKRTISIRSPYLEEVFWFFLYYQLLEEFGIFLGDIGDVVSLSDFFEVTESEGDDLGHTLFCYSELREFSIHFIKYASNIFRSESIPLIKAYETYMFSCKVLLIKSNNISEN